MKIESIVGVVALVGLGAFAINKFANNAGQMTTYQPTADRMPFDATQRTIRRDITQENRTDRVDIRQENRTDRTEARIDAIKGVSEDIQEGKTDRTGERQSTLRTGIETLGGVATTYLNNKRNTAADIINAVSGQNRSANMSTATGEAYAAPPKPQTLKKAVDKVENKLDDIKDKVKEKASNIFNKVKLRITR
jgi:hypothetical protein